MKRRKILTTLLALSLAFTFTVPCAANEEELPPAPVQEETTDPVPPPEDAAEELPPDSPEVPAPPEDVPPVEPPAEDQTLVEGEEIPGETPAPAPEEPPVPAEPEIPDVPVGPVPEDPEIPAEPAPEDPVPPDNPEAPPAPPAEEAPPPAEEEEPVEPEPEPEPPIINVIVPESGQVIINPYRMPVDLGEGKVQEQIINPMQTLVNLSTVPVQVDAWAVGTISPESRAQFVNLMPAPDARAKEIFMYAEFQNAPAMWSGWYGDMPNQILISAFGMSKANVLTLDPGAEGYFRLFGSMTDFPAEMWDTVDAPNVTVTFSFTPLVEELPAEITFPADIPADNNPEVLPPNDIFPPMDGAMLPPETEADNGQLEEQLVSYS